MMKTNIISRKFVKLFIGISAIVALAPGISACDSEDTSTYDLTVSWNIGGVNVCRAVLPEDQYAQSELTFTKVEVNVYEDDTKQNAVQVPVSVPCSAMETKITRLPRDSYYVTVEAFTDYQGQEIAFFQGAQEVSIPAKSDAVNIPLMVGTGEILVYWQFESGRTCGVAMAGEVANVAVILNDGQPVVTSCGMGQLLLENIATDKIYSIRAQALDINGKILYTTQHMSTSDTADFQVLPGQQYEAKVIF